MKGQISFKVINPDYDKKYARQYHDGKDSSGNEKFLLVNAQEIPDMKSVELIRDGTFHLEGKLPDGSTIDTMIKNVSIFRFELKNGKQIDFAVSKSVLNKTHQAHNEKYPVTRCYFYINSEPQGKQLSERIYIDKVDIPQQIQVLQKTKGKNYSS